MGFRNKRRHRGGGGQHHHHHHGFGTGEANGLQPGDDVGNRRSFKPVQLPPEDLGNRKDPEEEEWLPEDSVGNRIDAVPTHELSGILLELDGKRRRRRPKGVAAPERVGRFFVGGVNPLIATNIPRPFPGKTLEESVGAAHGAFPVVDVSPEAGREPSAEGAPEPEGFDIGADGDEAGGRRRRRRGRGRDQVDGMAAQEVSERRAQRFFDFEEDDRFDYTLKSDPEQKRKDAEDAVRSIVLEAGRDGAVLARLIEDDGRPKILVTIDERGPSTTLPPERRATNAAEPLFIMGNAALTSLNYLVNKIVNRYPDDRIRLAILPASGEGLYLDALAVHRKLRAQRPAPPVRPAPHAPPSRPPPVVEAATAAALSPPPVSGPVPLAIVEVPQVSAAPAVVVTPAPVGPAAPEEAFAEPSEPPEHLEPPRSRSPSAAALEEKAAAAAATVDEEPVARKPRGRRPARRDEDEEEAAPKKRARATEVEAKRPIAKKSTRTRASAVVEKVVVKAPRSSK